MLPTLVNQSLFEEQETSNREYEESEQDKKRKIKLLDPSFIDQFVEEFELLMSESPL